MRRAPLLTSVSSLINATGSFSLSRGGKDGNSASSRSPNDTHEAAKKDAKYDTIVEPYYPVTEFVVFSASGNDEGGSKDPQVVMFYPETTPISKQHNRVGLLRATFSLSQRLGSLDDPSTDEDDDRPFTPDSSGASNPAQDSYMTISTTVGRTGVFRDESIWAGLTVASQSTTPGNLIVQVLARAFQELRQIHGTIPTNANELMEFFSKWLSEVSSKLIKNHNS